jgi:beta-lactamase regulating signal transducer with metallopeptidase domain
MSAASAWPSPGFAIELVIKATIVLCASGALAMILRRATAATRHGLWLSALVAVLILPAAVASLPRWWVAVLPASETLDSSPAAASVGLADVRSLPPRSDPQPPEATGGDQPLALRGTIDVPTPSSDEPPPSRSSRSLGERTLVSLWLLGLGGWLAWLFGGALALGRIARAAQSLEAEESWARLLEEEAATVGVRRPVRILRSSAAGAPVTWGVRGPIVLLPLESESWSEERRRVVLRHELAHVARWDSLAQLIAACACGLYWFHPLAWWAARRLRSERERACDDRVLATGVSAPDYATHLVEVARAASALRMPAVVTAAMARPSELESRVVALLDPHRRSGRRTPLLQTSLMGAAAVALVAPIAAFRAIPKAGLEQRAPSSEPAEPRAVLDPKVSFIPEHSPTSSPTTQVVDVRDSAGVRIVQLGPTGGRAAAVRLSSAPLYRTPEGPSGTSLRSSENAVVFEDGSAAVVDALARQAGRVPLAQRCRRGSDERRAERAGRLRGDLLARPDSRGHAGRPARIPGREADSHRGTKGRS